MNQELYQKSLQIIRENQTQWGSYLASPAFPTYHFCWLRDGSYIAHAMDAAAEFGSSAAFYRWVGRTIQKYSYKIADIRKSLAAGMLLGKDDLLHTRFSAEGEEVNVDETWGNFQIDGYGTWLWALGEHIRLGGDASIVNELAEPIETTLQYLQLVWKLPNYDCWEEYPEFVHPYTLSTVYGGLVAASRLIHAGYLTTTSIPVNQLAQEVKTYLLTYGVREGRLLKHFAPVNLKKPVSETDLLKLKTGVDASLIGVSVPYQVVSCDDPLMEKTIALIEKELHRPEGGVYRYKEDEYYGGGEWILLSAWLGWYYCSNKEFAKAKQLCAWIEAQADENGFLAEQINIHLLDKKHYEPWLEKWGPVAKPLVWSHAMYILLVNELKKDPSNG